MSARHLSDDELIDRLYLGGMEEGHLGQCGECRERLRLFSARRLAAQAAPEIPPQFLAEQRRRIFDRVENRRAASSRLVPAGAFALLLLAAALINRPAPQPAAATLASNESGVFSEVYSLLESGGPRAAEPILGLFEEKQ